MVTSDASSTIAPAKEESYGQLQFGTGKRETSKEMSLLRQTDSDNLSAINAFEICSSRQGSNNALPIGKGLQSKILGTDVKREKQ